MPDFESLPTELLYQISGYLPPSSRVSLKLVNKHCFYRTRGVPIASFKDCEKCEKNAFKRFIDECEFSNKQQRRCVLCDGVRSSSFFRNSEVPICQWHDGWFLHTSISEHMETNIRDRLDMIASSTTKTQWIAIRRTYCVHDKDIVGWNARACECKCESCGHFEVICYVRVSPSCDKPLNWTLDRDRDGRFRIREEHFVESGFCGEVARECDPSREAVDVVRKSRDVPITFLLEPIRPLCINSVLFANETSSSYTVC